MYSVQPEPEKNRVLVTFEGQFDHSQDSFLDELKAAVSAAKNGRRHFDLIADFSKAPVMPQEQAKEGEDAIAWCVANGLRKSANLMDTIVQRMQVKRVSAQDERFGYFTTKAEAERWLEE